MLDKSWNYMQRALLYAGGMGATAVSLIVLLCLFSTSHRVIAAISVALGRFGYSVFWMWAGFRAPALGSTGAAKESLKWLAMPSSEAFVLATVAVLLVLIAATKARRILLTSHIPEVTGRRRPPGRPAEARVANTPCSPAALRRD